MPGNIAGGATGTPPTSAVIDELAPATDDALAESWRHPSSTQATMAFFFPRAAPAGLPHANRHGNAGCAQAAGTSPRKKLRQRLAQKVRAQQLSPRPWYTKPQQLPSEIQDDKENKAEVRGMLVVHASTLHTS